MSALYFYTSTTHNNPSNMPTKKLVACHLPSSFTIFIFSFPLLMLPLLKASKHEDNGTCIIMDSSYGPFTVTRTYAEIIFSKALSSWFNALFMIYYMSRSYWETATTTSLSSMTVRTINKCFLCNYVVWRYFWSRSAAMKKKVLTILVLDFEKSDNEYLI